MSKEKMNLRELVNKYQTNCDRINEMADTCEREKRMRTDAETAEYEGLLRENQFLSMKVKAAASEHLRENPDTLADANKIIRENIANGRETRIMLMREVVMVATAEAGGIVPVKMQDIIDPLTEGLILHTIGVPLLTGLSGELVWPTYEAVEATIAGEGVALSDTTINMSKLKAKPERIGLAIPVTRETINQTNGVVEMIIRKLMPLAVSKLLNKILFSVTKVGSANLLKGPFVDLKSNADTHTFAAAEPTFKELNLMKADVLKSGVDGSGLCYVMTKSMKAILEATPKDPGSGIMICENDKVAGLPVFTTNFIGEQYIGLGDWMYQPMGLFGDINFIVDPFTHARKNEIDFVLNADYGTATLQPKAFALKKVGPGK